MVVDQFSKISTTLPWPQVYSIHGTATVLLQKTFPQHRLPDTILSGMGIQPVFKPSGFLKAISASSLVTCLDTVPNQISRQSVPTRTLNNTFTGVPPPIKNIGYPGLELLNLHIPKPCMVHWKLIFLS
ncbi:hypothetical protein DSO57_1022690 [Entomophthora muscae]|uniref:Uncharacterized protein n=1 Tax=Entomophthora muscae TaxID=34485 RepID=A0ACC2TEA4_9FUNG|nr:hypothetical protein DSO57_1022690 [Entomophthora muscae]